MCHGMCATEIKSVTWLGNVTWFHSNHMTITWLHINHMMVTWSDSNHTTCSHMTWQWPSLDIPQEGSGTRLCLLQFAAVDHEKHPPSAGLQGRTECQVLIAITTSCLFILIVPSMPSISSILSRCEYTVTASRMDSSWSYKTMYSGWTYTTV